MKTNPSLLRTFQSSAKTRKNTIPILDYVKIENGIALFSDLETWVQFPIDKPDGYYDLRMNELFYISELDDKYPEFPKIDSSTLKTMTMNTGKIIDYAPCIAHDCLRPVMNAIYLDDKQIVASDAHVLRYGPHESNSVETGFYALFNPSNPILARCKVNKNEPVIISSTEKQIVFQFDDCRITTRMIEGTYPNFKAVTPKWKEKDLTCFSIPSETVMAMGKTSREFKRDLAKINKSTILISNLDFGLAKNWDAPTFRERPTREPDALLMPMLINDSPEAEEGFAVGFNAQKLCKIVASFKGNVVIGVYDPNSAMAIWLEQTTFLYSQKTAPKKQTAPAATPPPQQDMEPQPSTGHKPIPRKSPLPTGITIIEYSERSIAVFGNTKPLKHKLAELHGSFNKYLKYQNEPTPGWIFSKKRESQVRQLIAS